MYRHILCISSRSAINVHDNMSRLHVTTTCLRQHVRDKHGRDKYVHDKHVPTTAARAELPVGESYDDIHLFSHIYIYIYLYVYISFSDP